MGGLGGELIWASKHSFFWEIVPYIDRKGIGVIPKLRAGTLTLGSHGGWGGGGAIVGLTWIYIPHCPTARHLHYPMLLYILYILYIIYQYHPVYIILIDGVLYSSYIFSCWPFIKGSLSLQKRMNFRKIMLRIFSKIHDRSTPYNGKNLQNKFLD